MTTTPPPANPSAEQQRQPETSGKSPQSSSPPLPPEAYPTYPVYSGGGGSGYGSGQFGAPGVRRNDGMGVAALLLGIVGFVIGPCSILAIVFGRIGLNRAARGEAGNGGV